MARVSRGGADYVGYEYKEKMVPESLVSLYLDSYSCFGWEEDRNGDCDSNGGRRILHFRRDRRICNKTELTRLQRNFDGCIAEIERLEGEKAAMPTMWALVIGVLGTAFMAGSVFAVTAEPPQMLLSILLAVPGFLGWIVPFFLYQKLLYWQERRIAPLIEEKYDELYAICEKGSRLLI